VREVGQPSAQATDRHGAGADQVKREPKKRKKQRVGIIGVLAGAARVGRRHWWRILIVAIAVSMITTLAEIGVEELITSDNLPWLLVAELAASGLSLLGAVFLSGFLTKLVGHSQDVDRRTGDRRAGDTSVDQDHGISIRYVLRTLPWGRLIGADLLVALLVVLGLILLVIPGLILFNLLALAGPVIEVENRKVIAALRRSTRLVRGHFWSVALLATLPVSVAGEIETLAPTPHDLGELLKVLAIRGLGEGLAEAIIGLILVQLTQRLIVLDGEKADPERTR
jgi:hypothetical protein